MFAGIIEAYNVSARANAIRGYRFWEQSEAGEWTLLESELYSQRNAATAEVTRCNQTPLTLPPYSGVEVQVGAITTLSQTRNLRVRVEVEDLFGNHYRIEVTATA
jgi:hypothetical protein